MRICPDCHAPVGDTANFCDNCGYPMNEAPQAAPQAVPVLPQAAPFDFAPQPVSQMAENQSGEALTGACSACGFVNLPGEMFCQNCGVQLAPVASLPPPLPRPVSGLLPGQPVEAQIPSPPAPVDLPPAPVVNVIHGRLMVRATQQWVSLPEGESEAILGRSDPVKGVYPHIDLSPYGGDTNGVSRRHARLVAQADALYIEDLNSTNFTFVNHQKLNPGQRYPLQDGDEVRLGLMVLEFVA